MQNESISSVAYGNLVADGTKSQERQNGDGFTSLYSSFVLAPETTTSLSISPYTDPTINDSLYFSRLLMQQQQTQHQDMINRHNLCLTRLREAAREAENLRQENASLRSVNRELNKHLSLLIKSTVSDFNSDDNNGNNSNSNNNNAATSSFGVVNGMRGLSISGGGGEEVCVESPTSVIENVDVKRVSLPKSISVRSNGYLKMGQAAATTVPPAANPTKTRPRTPLKPTQKVYVRGGKQEEEPLELEVYNQGMFKTELCNKWQETGTCPYGDHCQFAHGIEELRPVIRHPRYKTEVCRMVLAGDVCPYGHRCHFRHALTDQERFMGHLNSRSIKLN
ncbi:zinc finger CCCH domain-containing protein 15 isoform X1 [Mangifera indica]|uniref:zinc finger CCCH domain-containing protein 15 isoform X1 n=1 Tax=Mangifera indica TaxID=29780 RepID=UPI001CFA9EE7|nr:zinc finger CCCH domain-containing protein 15 isoform X1 [Mangifera indica]XP_044488964.1 zinc finger CCCH domain-containing protein 15 isoform X1 [Mangifera indica]